MMSACFCFAQGDGLFYIDDGPYFDSLEYLIDHYLKRADGLVAPLKTPIQPDSRSAGRPAMVSWYTSPLLDMEQKRISLLLWPSKKGISVCFSDCQKQACSSWIWLKHNHAAHTFALQKHRIHSLTTDHYRHAPWSATSKHAAFKKTSSKDPSKE